MARRKRHAKRRKSHRSKKGWSPAKLRRYKAARRRLINHFKHHDSVKFE